MNVRLVTTGLVPLVTGSYEDFVLSPFLNGLPWDLTGGSVQLVIADPAANLFSYSATIVGYGARQTWAVPAAFASPGSWSRAWVITDAQGRHQVSRPIVFEVIGSPA